MFEIGFVDDRASSAVPHSRKELVGRIRIGTFSESFLASLVVWSRGRYIQQWREGLGRLCSEKHDSTALIVSLTDLSVPKYSMWWVLYRVADTVYAQNCMLTPEALFVPFDPGNPYAHIQPRETIDEDGERISEWAVPYSDIKGARVLE